MKASASTSTSIAKVESVGGGEEKQEKVVRPIGKLYTISEVCLILKVSRATVYRLMESERLAFYRVGNSRRVAVEQIEECLRQTSSINLASSEIVVAPPLHQVS